MALLKVVPQSEGGKSLCSDKTLNRLQAEAKALFESISDDPPSVGDAIFVEYEHAFCEEHKIGRFGRKTMKDGKVMFHAGPKEVVHPSVYLMDDHNHLEYIRQWREGGYCPVPMEKLLAGPKWPEMLVQKKPKMRTIGYEQALFVRVHTVEQKPITLVNPSFSTMTALKSSVGGYVTLTATGDHAWERDVRDFVNQSKRRLVMLPPRTVKGYAYLGTDVPQWFPEDPWFRLILSPFVTLNKDFPNYSVSFRDDQVVTRYEKKKNYLVSSVLERDSPYIVLNPETVDEYAGKKERWYYCESSFPLCLTPKDDVKVVHSPWFVTIPTGLEWVKEQCSGRERYVKARDGVVYDIKGDGTWLSRRSRIMPPVGMKWAPLLDKGTHWVTYSCLRPHRVYGVSVEKVGEDRVTIFDGAKLIKQLRRIDTSEMMLSEKPVPGLFNWKLDCDSGLYLVDNPTESQLPFGRRVRDILVTEEGKIFKYKEKLETGVWFLPGGQNFSVMGLGRGQLRPLTVFHTHYHDYVVLPGEVGDKYLFPRSGDIEMMCSTLSLFSSDWMTASMMAPTDGEAQLVSTDLAGQAILKAVMFDEIKREEDFGVTVPQISAVTTLSPSYLYRYLSVTAGYCVWKVEAGKIQFAHEKNLRIVQPGILNDKTAEGRSWYSIYQGSGKLKESYLFLNRDVRPLIRFLQWNYCMVTEIDRGEYLELRIRRPRRS